MGQSKVVVEINKWGQIDLKCKYPAPGFIKKITLLKFLTIKMKRRYSPATLMLSICLYVSILLSVTTLCKNFLDTPTKKLLLDSYFHCLIITVIPYFDTG